MNKYHEILTKIVEKGKRQENKKGSITYLMNQALELKPIDLLELFEGHGLARNKLKAELELFQRGERIDEPYKTQILERLRQENETGFVDWITVSSSLAVMLPELTAF